MLDIFILVPTSLPLHPTISPSINEVRSVAMSNVDEFTPNHLLQQMYETQVLYKDVDLELSDEELELIAGQKLDVTSCFGNQDKCHSDIFYQNEKIIDYDSFLEFMAQEGEQWKQIDYICEQFEQKELLNCDPQGNDRNVIAAQIWQQLRDKGPVAVKQQRGGFTVDLKTGQLTFNN